MKMVLSMYFGFDLIYIILFIYHEVIFCYFFYFILIDNFMPHDIVSTIDYTKHRVCLLVC